MRLGIWVLILCGHLCASERILVRTFEENDRDYFFAVFYGVRHNSDSLISDAAISALSFTDRVYQERGTVTMREKFGMQPFFNGRSVLVVLGRGRYFQDASIVDDGRGVAYMAIKRETFERIGDSCAQKLVGT